MMHKDFSPRARVVPHRQGHRIELVCLQRRITSSETCGPQGRFENPQDPPQEYVLSTGTHIIKRAENLISNHLGTTISFTSIEIQFWIESNLVELQQVTGDPRMLRKSLRSKGDRRRDPQLVQVVQLIPDQIDIPVIDSDL